MINYGSKEISSLLHTKDDLSLVDIDQSSAEKVSLNLEGLFNSPETPTRGLAINLYDAVCKRLGEISDVYPRINSNKTALYRLNDAKLCRDAVISGDFVLPAQRTIPYLERDQNNITLRKLVTNLPGLINVLRKKKFVHQYDDEVIVSDAVDRRQGDCMFAVIQSGDDQRVVKNATKTLQYLHQALGAEYTTQESEVEEAILLILDLVEPIKNDILRFLNVTLGPKKRL